MTRYTPNLQIPVPEPTDDTRTWLHWGAQADTIDAIASSPWLALRDPVGGSYTYEAYYRIIFGTVFLRGRIARTDGGRISPGDTLGTVTVGARPGDPIFLPVATAGGPNADAPVARLGVQTNGAMTILYANTGTIDAVWFTGVSWHRPAT